MTVGELIEELRKHPQHHPILCDVGLRYDESIQGVSTAPGCSRIGPSVVITTVSDPRNDPRQDEAYNYYGPEL